MSEQDGPSFSSAFGRPPVLEFKLWFDKNTKQLNFRPLSLATVEWGRENEVEYTAAIQRALPELGTPIPLEEDAHANYMRQLKHAFAYYLEGTFPERKFKITCYVERTTHSTELVEV